MKQLYEKLNLCLSSITDSKQLYFVPPLKLRRHAVLNQLRFSIIGAHEVCLANVGEPPYTRTVRMIVYINFICVRGALAGIPVSRLLD